MMSSGIGFDIGVHTIIGDRSYSLQLITSTYQLSSGSDTFNII